MAKLKLSKTYGLDPAKKYLLIMNRNEVTQADAVDVIKELQSQGITALAQLVGKLEDVEVVESD
jgi:hypothetical protein